MKTDSRERIPVSNLETIFRLLKDMRSDVDVSNENNSVLLEDGSKQFQVNKDGTVKSETPVKSLHTHNAERLSIGENEIEVHLEDGSYTIKI